MRRYIDADKLQKDGWKLRREKQGLLTSTYETMELDCVPTADVRENVRGEWITPTKKVYSMDGEDITSAYKECNRCHKVYVRTNDNYCPNCGAEMGGKS